MKLSLFSLLKGPDSPAWRFCSPHCFGLFAKGNVMRLSVLSSVLITYFGFLTPLEFNI